MLTKGFTLIELIGVVIILGLIGLLSFPTILNTIRNTKGKISEASKEVLYNATSSYITDNLNVFPKINGNIYCITLDVLAKEDYLPTKVYDAISGDEIPLTNIVEVKYEQDRYNYNLNNECIENN